MPRRDWAAQSRILALSHVNRHWHEALISLIYWRPVLTSARALRNFAALLQATPDLAKHVKGLILFDRTGDEDEQAEDSFFNTTYCTGGAIREQTQDALISLVACREPGTLNVIFITKSNQQMDVSERGGSLLRWGPRSMDHFHSLDLARRAACTALASLRSLTLHGFASHLLYTPSSAWFDTTSMAFRSLEQLALDSLRLGQIHWPNMPLLTTLTVKNCYIRGHALPSPGLAPRLRSLTWVNHQPFGTDFNTEGGFLTTVLWYSQSLSSLTIDFDDCQKLMKRADFGTAFPALRELASHDHRRNQGSIEAQHFPIRYPASLGILRMQTSWREVFVIFTTEHAQKALAPDVLAQFARTKKELHIMGDDAFWDRVPTWCLDEARVVCRRENVTYTNSVEQLLGELRSFVFVDSNLTGNHSSRSTTRSKTFLLR
jgi:hypothetical protein